MFNGRRRFKRKKQWKQEDYHLKGILILIGLIGGIQKKPKRKDDTNCRSKARKKSIGKRSLTNMKNILIVRVRNLQLVMRSFIMNL